MTTRCLFHFNTPPDKLSQASKDDQIFMLFYNFYQTVNSELDEILGKNVSGDAERNAVLTALKAGAGSGAEFCKLTRIIDCFQEFTNNQDKLTTDALTLYGPIGTDIPFIAEIYNNLVGLNYFTAKVASNPTEDCSPYKLVDLTDVIKHTFDDSGIREIIVKCFDPLLTKKLDEGMNAKPGQLKTNCDDINKTTQLRFTGGGKRKKRTASKKASSKKGSKKGSKKASKKASQKGGAKRRSKKAGSKKAGSKKASKKAGSKKAGSKKTSMKGGAKRRSKKAGSKKAASKKKASSKKTSMKGGKRRSRAGSKKVASKKVASKKVASKKTVSKRKASKKASSKKASMKGGKRRSRAGSKKSSKKGSKKVASKKRASKKGSKSRTRK